jgi:hypothetical protein
MINLIKILMCDKLNKDSKLGGGLFVSNWR